MTDSSDDSDCFESADEGFDDESAVKSHNIKSKSGKKDSNQRGTSGPTSCDISSTNNDKESSESTSTASSLQYRKRPERGKSASKPVQAVVPNRKTSLDEHPYETDIIKPDALIQDITINLSKNFNRGFSTIQQTSSSIKDLVINSLPVANLRECSSKFSYDDEQEISSQIFDSDDDSPVHSEITTGESKELATKPQHCTDSEKDPISGNESQISDVKEEEDTLEEALKSGLCNEIGAMEISESVDNKTIEDKSVHEVKTDNVYISAEGLGDDNCEKNLPDHEKHEQMFEETKDLSEDLLEDSCNKNEAKSLPEISIKDDEKVSSYEKQTCQKSIVERLDEENNVFDSTNERDGWDSAELELEGIDEIEESTPNVSMGATENEKKEQSEPEIKETAQNIEENEMSDDNEGWDDFDIDDEELEMVKNENKSFANGDKKAYNQYIKQESNQGSVHHEQQQSSRDENKNFGNDTKWSGWENFGEKQETKQKSGWNLGSWGVNALLNTATTVTQGLSTVIEAGLGIPDPETLARMQLAAENAENASDEMKTENVQEKEGSPNKTDDNPSSGLNLFPTFGITNLVAGVTKNIVENTKVQEIGTKVITGGLDTLESFGKKTMEVLQEGDPGLKKKRALLLGSNKPILSQVLREAKAKAEVEDRRMEEKQMAKMCHFETLFDDYQGLIHLEALEMLSRQCELKLEQMKASLPTSEVEDLIGILDEVKELCVIDEDEFKANYSTMVDFKISLMKAIEPLKNEISTQKIIQVYEELDAWLKNPENANKSPRGIFQKAMSTLAELTAATVAQFHKGGELLSIKEHRKTVEEAEALLQMTGFLCCEINSISQKFLKLYTSCLTENDKEMTVKIKEEANNATLYIKDAFNLLIPVLQLGAAT